MSFSDQKYSVKNTFVESDSDAEGDAELGLRRSSSDSVLSLSASSSFERKQNNSQERQAANSNHQVWHSDSSSKGSSSSEKGGGNMRDGRRQPHFDLEEAKAAYDRVCEVSQNGAIDVREVARIHFPGMDMARFCPLDPESEQRLSLGSVAHFYGNCSPCMFASTNRCWRLEFCMYCHFPHSSEVSTWKRASKKSQRSAKKREQRLKEEKQAESGRQEEQELKAVSTRISL
eukprot:gnl/MRDRNA2_/MRDRNA2_80145_c0_seq1.p1 gnl/MRDRNA2_/MRDRNA2_80145_c0~~gnl/MRDRNA2_/MRDRNA2_80145_c0_seq1.p1  ORF type:complete len:231 (-),score=40.14 gnl/MRDRNA2_/MRDRNA2_80145_c0_seq1:116-808(-)